MRASLSQSSDYLIVDLRSMFRMLQTGQFSILRSLRHRLSFRSLTVVFALEVQHTFTANATDEAGKAVRKPMKVQSNCRARSIPDNCGLWTKTTRPEIRKIRCDCNLRRAALSHVGSLGSGIVEATRAPRALGNFRHENDSRETESE